MGKGRAAAAVGVVNRLLRGTALWVCLFVRVSCRPEVCTGGGGAGNTDVVELLANSDGGTLRLFVVSIRTLCVGMCDATGSGASWAIVDPHASKIVA